MDTKKISGTLFIPSTETDFSRDCIIYLSIEDISKQDVSSDTLCKKTYEHIGLDALRNGFPFSIEVPVQNENAHLVVRAHVDVDQDGEVSKGDYITTGMFSVLTRGNPDTIDVKLQKI